MVNVLRPLRSGDEKSVVARRCDTGRPRQKNHLARDLGVCTYVEYVYGCNSASVWFRPCLRRPRRRDLEDC